MPLPPTSPHSTRSAQRLMVDIERLLPSTHPQPQPQPHLQPQNALSSSAASAGLTAIDSDALPLLFSHLTHQITASPTQHTASALCTFLSTLRHRLPLLKTAPNSDQVATILFQSLAHLFYALSATRFPSVTPAWSQAFAHLFATLSDLLTLKPAIQPVLSCITRDLVPLLDPNDDDDDHVSDTSRASIGLILVQLSNLDQCKRTLCAHRAMLLSALEHANDALVQEILLEVLWRILPRDIKGKRALLKDLIVRDRAWIQWLIETKSKELYQRMRVRMIEANRGKSATGKGQYPMTIPVKSVRVSQDGSEYVMEQNHTGVYVDCSQERFTCTGAWVGAGLGGEDEEEQVDRVLSVPYGTILSVDEDGLDLHIRASHAPSLTDPTHLTTIQLVHVHFASTLDRQRVVGALRAHAPVSTQYSFSGTLARQSSALIPLNVTSAPGAKTPEIQARAARFLEPVGAADPGQEHSQPKDVDMDSGRETGYADEHAMDLTRTIDVEFRPPTTLSRGHVHVHMHQESSTTTRRPNGVALDNLQIQAVYPSLTGSGTTSSPVWPALVDKPIDDASSGVTFREDNARGRPVVGLSPDAFPGQDKNQGPRTGRTGRSKRASSPTATATDTPYKRTRMAKDTQNARATPLLGTPSKHTLAKPHTLAGGIVDFGTPVAREPTSDTIGDEEGSVTPEQEQDLAETPSGPENKPTQPEAGALKSRPATRGTTASELTDLSSSSRPESADIAGQAPQTLTRHVLTREKAKEQGQQTMALAESRPRRKAASASGSSPQSSSPEHVLAWRGAPPSRRKRVTRNSTESAAALDSRASAAFATEGSSTRTRGKKRPVIPVIQEDEVNKEEMGSEQRTARSAQQNTRARHPSTPPPVISQPFRQRTRPPTPPPLDLADFDDTQDFESTMLSAAKRRSPITGRTPPSPAVAIPTNASATAAALPALVEDADEDTRHTWDPKTENQLPSPVARPVASGTSHVLTTAPAPPLPAKVSAPAPDDELKGLMMQLMRSMNEHTMQMRTIAGTAPRTNAGREMHRDSSMDGVGGTSSLRSGEHGPEVNDQGKMPVTPAPEARIHLPLTLPAPVTFRLPGKSAAQQLQQQPAPSTPWPKFASAQGPRGDKYSPTGAELYSTPGPSTRTSVGAAGLPTPRSMLGTPRHHQGLSTPQAAAAARPPIFATPYSASDRGYMRTHQPPHVAPAADLPHAVSDAILSAYHAMAQTTIAHLSTLCANNWARVEEVMRELEGEVAGSVEAWVDKVRVGMQASVQGLKEGEAGRVEREREVVERVRGVMGTRR